MRERDRQSLRKFREELEAEERAEREKQERPIREAEEKLKATHFELIKVYRERLLGRVRDPEVFVDELVGPTVRMTKSDANNFTTEQARMYFRDHPEYYSNELAEILTRYWTKNEIEIATYLMFKNLVDRIIDAGLLPERPFEPEPEPEPTLEQRVERFQPEVFEGWDLDSGTPRSYSKREVDAMDSTTYRKVFRLYKADLALPNRGPGPTGSK